MAKKYTDEEKAAITSKYDVLQEFRTKEKKLYNALSRRKLIGKWCSHMKRACVPPGTRDKEHCHAAALRYETRTDFFNGARHEYCTAQRHGWLDEICAHMVPKANWYKRKIYVFTFSDGYAYVGLTHDPERRRIEHLCENYSAVFKHVKDTGASYEFEVLTDWLSITDAGKIEDEYIQRYADEGWKMLNQKKGGSLGGKKETFYTHERLVAEIGKYEYYEDFVKHSRKYYNYLLRVHLLEQYTSVLKHRTTPLGFWTIEQSISAAKQCETRMELNKKYPGAYEVLREAGLLKNLLPLNKGLPKEVHMARIAECNSRSDLYFKYQSTYNWALRNEMLDSLYKSKVHYRTYEEKMNIIKNCATRRELREKYGRVYHWALKQPGLLDKYFPR